MIKKTGTKTNADIVYEKIKNKILSCEFKPGQLVSEKEIVEEFNFSRTPVRQALNHLSGEGLVEILPKKGIQISLLSERNVKEIIELRRLLEPLAIRQAMRYIQLKDVECLIELDKSLKKNLETTDILEIFKIGIDIHLYIAKLSNNSTLYKHIKLLRDESFRSLVYYLKEYLNGYDDITRTQILESIGIGHTHLIEAIKERDEEKAVNAILEDLDTMYELIVNRNFYK